MTTRWLALAALAAAAPLAAQDSAFHAMQQRGHAAMGVDQYTSYHQFDDLPDGGRIALQRDSTDAVGVAAIRAHLRHIVVAFARGDFALPGFVHAKDVPGTAVMSAQRASIRYEFHELPGGGEVRIATRNPQAVSAVHQFLAFQRSEHRVGRRHPH